MDKFNLTPRNSNVESLIEKFRLEFGNAVEEDRSNNRRISISPIKFDSNPSCNLDSQIKELEDVIEKLQNEITDLSRRADNEYSLNDLSGSKKSYIIGENREVAEFMDDDLKNKENDDVAEVKENEQCSHVFPLLIKDMMLPINPEKRPLKTVVSELLSLKSEDSSDQVQINALRQEVLNLWSDLKDYAPKDNLNDFISELQTEITDVLETLNVDAEDGNSPTYTGN